LRAINLELFRNFVIETRSQKNKIMKKLVFLFAIVISVICVSCAGSKKNACPAYSNTSLEKPYLVA
jgi:hypothetical protein